MTDSRFVWEDGQITVLNTTKQLHLKLGVKGGPGSGNFGHAGRPGKLGGSVPVRKATLVAPEPKRPQTGADAVQMVGDIHDKYVAQREELRAQDIELRNKYAALYEQRAIQTSAGSTVDSETRKELNAILQQRTSITAKTNELNLAERQEIFDKVLKVDDPVNLFTSVYNEQGFKANMPPNVQAGIDKFSQLVDKKAVGGAPGFSVAITVSNAAGRAYFSDRNGVTLYSRSTKGDSMKITTVHELGHALEDASATAHVKARTFLYSRTKGDKARPIAGYDKTELFRPDDFYTPYVGKNYPGGTATEIISMGLQAFVTDPWHFAMKDPEHFATIWELARGIQ